MSIYTLTLSPAVDKSTTVPQILPESKLRCNPPKFEPGGGGINVSRAIKKLGGDSIAIYPQGGPTGELLVKLLKEEGIQQLTVPSKNWSRENFIVVEKSTNRQYRFGMPGPDLDNNEWKDCLDLIKKADNIDYLVASGSTPGGVPDDFYCKLSQIARDKKARLILDTSGAALEAALKEGIYLCKPNISELGALVGEELDSIPKQEEAAMKIINTGKVEVLVVSLGAFGAFLASKDGIINVPAPSVAKRSTVGAGDSMVAGIVFSLSNGKSLFDSLKYGIACGTAATMNSGTELCKKEDVEKLYTWISAHASSNAFKL